MLAKPSIPLLFFFVFYSLNSWALEPRSIASDNIIFNSEILYHPAGPSIKSEWRSNNDGGIIQVEIKKAKSGQILLEKLKLVYQNKVGWRIEDINGNVKLKINSTSINSENPLNLKINDQMWAITLSNEEIPKAIQGLATETEPRVDIFIKLVM